MTSIKSYNAMTDTGVRWIQTSRRARNGDNLVQYSTRLLPKTDHLKASEQFLYKSTRRRVLACQTFSVPPRFYFVNHFRLVGWVNCCWSSPAQSYLILSHYSGNHAILTQTTAACMNCSILCTQPRTWIQSRVLNKGLLHGKPAP
jgi:hypothetical protein